MTTRPDLDAIEADFLERARLMKTDPTLLSKYKLITYCRELEEENKRLRSQWVNEDKSTDQLRDNG